MVAGAQQVLQTRRRLRHCSILRLHPEFRGRVAIGNSTEGEDDVLQQHGKAGGREGLLDRQLSRQGDNSGLGSGDVEAFLEAVPGQEGGGSGAEDGELWSSVHPRAPAFLLVTLVSLLDTPASLLVTLVSLLDTPAFNSTGHTSFSAGHTSFSTSHTSFSYWYFSSH